MFNSLVWTTLKKIGINLPITPSNPLFRPRLSHKKIYSAKRTREKKRYTLAEPCYYSLSRSRSFRNCRVALLLCQFVLELKVFFCLFWLVLFLMLYSAFILSIVILICVHARFLWRKISHPSCHPFIRRPFIIPPTRLSISNPVQTGHE